MDEDWDLLAVVRSCIHTTAATNPNDIDTAAEEAFPLLTLPDLGGDRNPVQSPDPMMGLPRNHDPSQELQEVWKPYVSPPEPVQTSQTAVVSHINPNPPFSGFRGLVEGLQLQQKQHQPPQLELGSTHFQNATTNTTTTLSFHTSQYSPQPKPRPKRSSNQQKRVVTEVAAESLSTDLWSWRKYGQKPIKGSPHPRNYYRCSSSKGCGARKQVERSSTDPNTFLVTYTGDHSHPRLITHCNSFTRIARSKFFAAVPISTPSPTTLLTGSMENQTEDPTVADAARKTNVEENVKAMAEMNSSGIERYIDDKDSDFGGGILSPNMAIWEDILMGWQE